MPRRTPNTADLATALGGAILTQAAAVLVAGMGEVRLISPAAAELLCLGAAEPAGRA